MSSNVVHNGYVTKCEKGLFKSSSLVWMTLSASGQVSFSKDSAAAATKTIDCAAMYQHDKCNPRGPWTHGTDETCRFELISPAHEVVSLEARTPAEAAEWADHIGRLLHSAPADDSPVPDRIPPHSSGTGSPASLDARYFDCVFPTWSMLNFFNSPESAGQLVAHAASHAAESVAKIEDLILSQGTTAAGFAAATLRDVAIEHVKGVLMDKVVGKVVGAVTAALTALPYGSVAVALGSAVVARVGQFRENQTEAQVVGKLAGKLARCSSALMQRFVLLADEEALGDAQELCDCTLTAYGIFVELTAKQSGLKGFGHQVLLFVGTNSAAAALEEARSAMLTGMTTVTFLSEFSTPPAPPQSADGELPAFFAPLQGINAANEAIAFWRKFKLGPEVAIQDLLDCLQLEAQELDLVPDALAQTPFDQIPALYGFFAGANNSETTRVARFALFLGKAPTLAIALQPFLGGPATASSSRPLRRGGAQKRPAASATIEWAEQVDESVPVDVRRRRVLDPIDFGNDRVRLQASFVEGTRQWLFAAVADWAALPLGHVNRRVFWLQGTAGLGKSVVAAQLVKMFGADSEHRSGAMNVAAYIFCKHDDQARNDPLRIIATLAFRLAAQLPAYAQQLDELISDDSARRQLRAHVEGKTDITAAFDALLAQPLQRAKLTSEVVVLIDALDELADGPRRTAFLNLIGTLLPSLPSSVRFLVTSRPDADIVSALQGLAPLVLAKNDAQQTADLKLYLQHEAVSKTSLQNCSQADQDAAVAHLLDRADGVFVAAAMSVMTLQQNFGEEWTLARVKAQFTGKGDALTDTMYRGVLERLMARLDRVGDPELRASALTLLHATLSVIVAAARPVTLAELPVLCGGQGWAQSRAGTRKIIELLSMLFVGGAGGDKNAPLAPFHKSVFDFLRDEKRAGAEWVVVEAAGHATLAGACLRAWQANGDDEESDSPAGAYVTKFTATHLAECARRGLKGAKHAGCATMVQAWLAALGVGDHDIEFADDDAGMALLERAADKLKQLGEYALSLAWYELVAGAAAAGGRRRRKLLLQVAWVAGRAGDLKRQAAAASEAAALLANDKSGGGSELAQVAVWDQLADSLNQQGKYAEALELYEKVLAVVRRVYGEKHVNLAATYKNMAIVYNNQGKDAQALEFYGKALAVFQVALGENHFDTASSYMGMAGVYADQGKSVQALKYYDKALTIRQVALGENHPDTASTYNNIAGVYSNHGLHAEALEFYGKALAIRHAALGENHPDTASTYNNMAVVFKNQGKLTDALEFCGKALAIQQVVLGENHPKTAGTYYNMAGVYKESGDFAKALEFYGNALVIREVALGENHLDTASTYTNMADICANHGDFAQALGLYGKALAIFLVALGENHHCTACTYNIMAVMYNNQGKHAEALEFYGKALAIKQVALGENHPDTALTYTNMAVVCKEQGKYTEALEFYGKALAIQQVALFDNHPDTAATYNNMAMVYDNQGKHAQALEFYGKALAIRQVALGENHPNTANMHYNMAIVYKTTGDYARAVAGFKKAQLVYEHVFGADHDETRDAVSRVQEAERLLCGMPHAAADDKEGD